MPVDELTTERILEGVARIGQHRFAAGVLANCGGSCVFCGFKPAGLEGHRLMVPSHIKPWRESTDRERLDIANGLAACPTHDAAFDTGLLYVNGGLRVHRSPKLAATQAMGADTTLLPGAATGLRQTRSRRHRRPARQREEPSSSRVENYTEG